MKIAKNSRDVPHQIKADTKVLLTLETKSGTEGATNRLTLGSYVEKVVSDDIFLIHMPVHRGYNYPLPRDEPISMYLLTKKRMYSVMAVFMERLSHDGLLYAKMRKCSPIKPGQRRDCFRLPCGLPVAARLITDSKANTEPGMPSECRMIDISDGGMLFATNGVYAIGEKISLAFNIGTDEAITAEVLRHERIERSERIEVEQSTAVSNGAPNALRNKAAVRFVHKCQKQKNRFYKFIVGQQLKNMREQAEQEAKYTANE